MESLAGHAYLVTGGGTGIGASVALRLAELGASVAVLGRRKEPLDALVVEVERRGGQALAHPADVRDPAAVEAAVEAIEARFGKVDGLVNNAAGNFVAPAENLSANGWRAVVDIVLNGAWNCTSAVARRLIRDGRPGAVVNVVATYAWTGHPGTVHSAAAKAGVVSMTKTLAVEWARYGIRLNCVAPGPTETEGAGAALWGSPEERERVLSSVPLRRFASAEEIAGLTALLLSDRASYITGATLTADGGQSLGRQIYGTPVEELAESRS
ncbi:SDR family oxidoreductase [Spongiactinospora sp. TRM90649]|uniref:SDR family oxidoreductase n=1 Tax=Spongiactinospora sp. TRM90649 TaxID=3031114 RepID=UPI0023F8DB3D|nr:SDR family oxidoreductase [Spongiactinospora sp. TRM90649]MDF5751674.1 SDR family oxidoreductase [Spongiactinospora sp. TRM90649]